MMSVHCYFGYSFSVKVSVIVSEIFNFNFYCTNSYANAVLAVTILSLCLSVCPFVCVLCDNTKQCTVDILISHEIAITLVS